MKLTIKLVAAFCFCVFFSCANDQDPRLDAISRLEKAGVPRADAVKRVDGMLAEIGTAKDLKLPIETVMHDVQVPIATIASSYEELEAQLEYQQKPWGKCMRRGVRPSGLRN